ncbi:MAG: hypothetical protein HWD59_06875 [Coxiellaceae bacterium]|nr:MAG: hypothetical protein HWD59_06875 [Coxiellaceae bacterium]
MRKIKNNLHGIKFDRHHLPKPFHYYSKHFPHLKMRAQWVSVHCCFHVDRQPSLRLNLETGAFRCFGCGVKGVMCWHFISSFIS